MALHIRIKQKGLQRYTGTIGMIDFEEGRSVDVMSIQEALRVGASMPITDDEGNEISPVTYYSRQANAKREEQAREAATGNVKSSEGSNSTSDSDSDSGDEDKVEINNQPKEPEDTSSGEEPEDQTDEEQGDEGKSDGSAYTREYLESVADDKGIKGLREIGEKHDIAAKSIEEMINKLLDI